jgi:hypothetical protein
MIIEVEVTDEDESEEEEIKKIIEKNEGDIQITEK